MVDLLEIQHSAMVRPEKIKLVTLGPILVNSISFSSPVLEFRLFDGSKPIYKGESDGEVFPEQLIVMQDLWISISGPETVRYFIETIPYKE